MESLKYELREKLIISVGGTFQDAFLIEFQSPNMGCRKQINRLRQLIMGGLVDLSKSQNDNKNVDDDDDNKEKKNPTAKEIKVILLSLDEKRFPFTEIQNAFVALAIKIGKIDGEFELKEEHFDKILLEDLEDMVCEYIAGFIFPSLF